MSAVVPCEFQSDHCLVSDCVKSLSTRPEEVCFILIGLPFFIIVIKVQFQEGIIRSREQSRGEDVRNLALVKGNNLALEFNSIRKFLHNGKADACPNYEQKYKTPEFSLVVLLSIYA